MLYNGPITFGQWSYDNVIILSTIITMTFQHTVLLMYYSYTLTSLQECNLQPGSKCNCAELKRILFKGPEESDLSLKADDLKKLKWTGQDGEKIANHIEEKIRRTSETRLLQNTEGVE